MYKQICTIAMCLSFVYAGDTNLKNYQKALPEVKTIQDNSSRFYVGLGSGYMNLEDDYTKEVFDTIPLVCSLGYRYNAYLAIEARYTRSITVRYDGGHTISLDDDDFPTTFENKALYIKPSYPVTNNVGLYVLLGYGEVSLSDIKGSDRIEDGFEWGIGLSYHISSRVNVFMDYTNLYNNNGFDGRAIHRNVTSGLFVLGASYAF